MLALIAFYQTLAPFKSNEVICMGVSLKYDIITSRQYDDKTKHLNSVDDDDERT